MDQRLRFLSGRLTWVTKAVATVYIVYIHVRINVHVQVVANYESYCVQDHN